MAEERIGATCKDCSQALSVEREVGVAHRVDTRVKSMQATGVNSAIYGAARITKRADELTDRDHAMLALCEFRKAAWCSRSLLRPFVPHSDTNDRSARSLPPPRRFFVPRQRFERKKSRRPGADGFEPTLALRS